MAFVNLLSLKTNKPSQQAQQQQRQKCRRRPRMVGVEAPVKEDLRTRLNDLLKATPSLSTSKSDTDSDKTRQKVDPGKNYKVLIYNDEFHTKDYVTKVLLKIIPGLTQQAALHIMTEAHSRGRAVVGIWIFEISEGYCDLLRTNGLRSDIEEA